MRSAAPPPEDSEDDPIVADGLFDKMTVINLSVSALDFYGGIVAGSGGDQFLAFKLTQVFLKAATKHLLLTEPIIEVDLEDSQDPDAEEEQ